MPFKDTPEGTTHSYNDGCGEPAHNDLSPEQVKQEILEEFIEKGADIEHARWSSWQKYLHSLCSKNDDGTLTIPAWQVERAERQIATDYVDLTEKEKESDRKEVRTYLPMLSTALDRMAEAAVAMEIERIVRWAEKRHDKLADTMESSEDRACDVLNELVDYVTDNKKS